jgi:hypothetical protein
MRHRSPTLSLCGSLVVLVATLASPHAVAQTTGPVRHGTPQSLLRVTFDRTVAETNRTLRQARANEPATTSINTASMSALPIAETNIAHV